VQRGGRLIDRNDHRHRPGSSASITYSIACGLEEGLLHPEEEVGLAAEERAAEQIAALDALAEELARLRKAVLRQGHAQELFQARVEEAVGRLAGGDGAAAPPRPEPGLTSAQVRALQELDQAVLQLLRLAEGADRKALTPPAADPAAPEEAPHTLREGLSLLQIRVRNLQHSLGLEAVPAQNRPFDDRWHEVSGVACRPDLPDRWVVEEILPGYRLGDRVLRPARVVVNRRS